MLYFWVCPLGAFVTFKCGTVIFSWYSYLICIYDIIHLLYAGEGNMQIYSSKSIIFPEGIARGHRPRGIWYSRFKILLTTFRHINMLHEDITYIQYYMAKWAYIIKNIKTYQQFSLWTMITFYKLLHYKKIGELSFLTILE